MAMKMQMQKASVAARSTGESEREREKRGWRGQQRSVERVTADREKSDKQS
jgi:hypothetical protein